MQRFSLRKSCILRFLSLNSMVESNLVYNRESNSNTNKMHLELSYILFLDSFYTNKVDGMKNEECHRTFVCSEYNLKPIFTHHLHGLGSIQIFCNSPSKVSNLKIRIFRFIFQVCSKFSMVCCICNIVRQREFCIILWTQR